MVERVIERFILISRWLMAPFYLGLIIALGVLLFKFAKELWHFVTYAPSFTESDTILGILALIDLTFTGSLVIIVIFSGYENFVSKIDGAGHPDWPEWMTKVDFSGLKQKLLASIIAISAIALLKAFMNLDKGVDEKQLYWLVIIHCVFVVSGIVLAWSDKLSEGKGNGH